jgi:hypothetical protein
VSSPSSVWQAAPPPRRVGRGPGFLGCNFGDRLLREKRGKNVSRSLYVRSMGFEGQTKTPSSSRGGVLTEPILLKEQNKGSNDRSCDALNDNAMTKQAAAAEAAGSSHPVPDVNLGVEFDLGAENSAYVCPPTSTQRSEMCQLNLIARATEGNAQESKATSACESQSETTKTGTKPDGELNHPPGQDFPAQDGVYTYPSS